MSHLWDVTFTNWMPQWPYSTFKAPGWLFLKQGLLGDALPSRAKMSFSERAGPGQSEADPWISHLEPVSESVTKLQIPTCTTINSNHIYLFSNQNQLPVCSFFLVNLPFTFLCSPVLVVSGRHACCAHWPDLGERKLHGGISDSNSSHRGKVRSFCKRWQAETLEQPARR